MSERKAKIESRWSYTPPPDVVSEDLWTHGKERRKRKPPATRPDHRRSYRVMITLNKFELEKLDELLIEMSKSSTKFGFVQSRTGVLRMLLKQAHRRLSDVKKRAAKA